MARRYAEDTRVPIERSRSEIESILVQSGASQFGFMMLEDRALIEFRMGDRRIRFTLPTPAKDEARFKSKMVRNTKRTLTPEQSYAAWQQACMQRWRALRIAIVAKLEAVQCGISRFEEEFLSHVVDPVTNRTVYECLAPQLKLSYEKPNSGHLLALPAPTDE